jgi:hypothetical protein
MAPRPPAAEPVFILAPPCTFSWAVCAMLGEHPQLYALPELHLFLAETVAGWRELCSRESFDMDHGLVRAVAELYFGGQTDQAASRARGWLRRRGHFTTGLLLEVIADRLNPLVPVEKSPSLVYSSESLRRALDMFPRARFLHLVSHPRRYGETVMQAVRAAAEGQPLPPSHWLIRLATFPYPDLRAAGRDDVLDPQVAWFALTTTISDFLASVPEDQRRTVRGEDLLTDTDAGLAQVADWLGVRTDSEAVEAMRHPERSAFARPGPSSASFGSDIFLADGPLIRLEWTQPCHLEGPLGWRDDHGELLPEVRQLARRLGYE